MSAIVTNAGRQVAAFLFAQAIGTSGPQYMAISASMTTPDPNDTDIGTEIGRVPVSVLPIGTSVIVTGYFGVSDLNGQWYKVGIFGNGATSVPGSGILIAEGLQTYLKLNSQTVQFDVTIAF